jgi:hypothetical protein
MVAPTPIAAEKQLPFAGAVMLLVVVPHGGSVVVVVLVVVVVVVVGDRTVTVRGRHWLSPLGSATHPSNS